MLWKVIKCCGVLWKVIKCCGMLWKVIKCCGMLWNSVGCCGMLWNSVGCCGRLRNVPELDDQILPVVPMSREIFELDEDSNSNFLKFISSSHTLANGCAEEQKLIL